MKRVDLSQRSIARLADALAPRVAKIILEQMRLKEPDEEEWLNTKEAAELLGISQGHLRRHKDEYTHTKLGDAKQGNLRFLRSSLIPPFTETKRKDA